MRSRQLFRSTLPSPVSLGSLVAGRQEKNIPARRQTQSCSPWQILPRSVFNLKPNKAEARIGSSNLPIAVFLRLR